MPEVTAASPTWVTYTAPERPFELPPEIEELKLLARRVVDAECIPLESEFLANRCPDNPDVNEGQYEIDGSLPAERWQHLRKVSEETGLYRAWLPAEYGGAGLGVLGSFVLAEELNRSVVELPTALVPPVLFEGNDEQKQRLIEATIVRDERLAFAQTEPDAGSDPGHRMTTSATRCDGGWLINGTKIFITDADRATRIMTLAVTDDQKRQRGGITLFLVDRAAEGLSVEPISTWLSTKPHQFTVHYDNVFVADADVLGGVGNGFALGQMWLAITDRLTRGSLATGILSRGLEIATEWAADRVTFGKPLKDRQAIQWMLVDVLLDLKAIRALSYECAARADAGEDVRTLAAMAKFAGANWGHRSIDRLMQVLGGMGETTEHPFPHWYRILRHGRIGGGTDEIQRVLMSRAIFGEGKSVWQA